MKPERCNFCHRRLDRPAPTLAHECAPKHAKPDAAQRCAEDFEQDLLKRHKIGFEWLTVHKDVQDEARDKWAGIVRKYSQGDWGKTQERAKEAVDLLTLVRPMLDRLNVVTNDKAGEVRDLMAMIDSLLEKK
jgi:hypothetical protein